MFNHRPWTSIISSLLTHTLAALIGAGLVFATLVAAISEASYMEGVKSDIYCWRVPKSK
jgi:hypothetical protein